MKMVLKESNINNYWHLSQNDLFSQLNTSAKGLDTHEAGSRLKQYGQNDIAQKSDRHGLSILAAQFISPLVILLLIASIISIVLGEVTESIVILLIVVVNGVLGFYQEYKAEKAIRQLRKLIILKSKVIRDSSLVEIDSKWLVPGDIVYLEIGDIIPADMRLISAEDLACDESSLTGESLPVSKKVGVVSAKKLLPQDLNNCLFMGTNVVSGEGQALVINTGLNTILGKTAAYLKDKAPVPEFQKGIKEFGNFLLKITLIMTILVFVINAVLGKNVIDSFVFAIALAVGITPEMLPIIMTICLSNGAIKLSKKKVITKRLSSIEDLGNMDTLCMDKTGTLTEGEVTLHNFCNIDIKKDDQVLLYGLLCNSLHPGKIKLKKDGNAIDKAICNSQHAKSLNHEFKKYNIVDDNEFDFERRRMSVVVSNNNKLTLIVKGAAESVLAQCKLASGQREKILQQIHNFENDGLRVIAIASRDVKSKNTSKTDETNLIFNGYLLFLDPPKKSAKSSLEAAERLGVSLKILSGDSPLITEKICRELALTINQNRVITGEDLDNVSEHEFQKFCLTYNVFARVTPEQKYKIVSALNHEGHVVGFLGDGINDAPALKAADVGISVDSAAGIAKEAADIILLEKSLSVLNQGIMEGRKIFGNITKYILNTISANYGNMFTMAFSSVFLKFIPLLPSQILLNNFISDIPLIFISADHVDEEYIRKPKKWDIKMIAKFMRYFGFISTFFDLALIIPLILLFKVDIEVFRTAWFLESTLSEMIITFSIRTRRFFAKSRPSRALFWSTVFCVLGSFIFVCLPIGRSLFQFAMLPLSVFLYIIVILVLYFSVSEIAKRKFFKKFDL